MKNKILEHLEEIKKLVLTGSLKTPEQSDIDISKYRLCYIGHYDANIAYFTSNFENQWGDDWNDYPANCNAGNPYYPHPNCDGEWIGDVPKYTLIRAGFLFPDDCWEIVRGDETHSVEKMNKCGIPWLSAHRKVEDKKIFLQISGGMSIPEFISAIEDFGGTVLVPRLGWASEVYPKKRER